MNLHKPTKTLPCLLGTVVADALLPITSNVLATGRRTLSREAIGVRRAYLIAALYPSSTPKTWTIN